MATFQDLSAAGYAVDTPPLPDVGGMSANCYRVSGLGVAVLVGADDQAAVDALANRAQQWNKLNQAHDYFVTRYQDWDTLTADQKDAAMKNAMRALANLTAYVIARYSDAGA